MVARQSLRMPVVKNLYGGRSQPSSRPSMSYLTNIDGIVQTKVVEPHAPATVIDSNRAAWGP